MNLNLILETFDAKHSCHMFSYVFPSSPVFSTRKRTATPLGTPCFQQQPSRIDSGSMYKRVANLPKLKLKQATQFVQGWRVFPLKRGMTTLWTREIYQWTTTTPSSGSNGGIMIFRRGWGTMNHACKTQYCYRILYYVMWMYAYASEHMYVIIYKLSRNLCR